jgi:hypothetical protein
MFDLEQAIADWRDQMLAAGIQTPVPLEELEIHLREEIERLMKTGLGEPQALEIAMQSIGNAKMLKNEFEKDQFTKEARDRKLKQVLFVGSLSAITLLVASMLWFRFGVLKDDLTNAQQMSGLASLAVMIALVVGGRLGYRFFPVISSRRVRDAIGATGGVIVVTIWTYCFNFVLPRHDYTICQLVVAILWIMAVPAGILGGLMLGMETAAWKRLHKP